jgi:hypothetical protein
MVPEPDGLALPDLTGIPRLKSEVLTSIEPLPANPPF